MQGASMATTEVSLNRLFEGASALARHRLHDLWRIDRSRSFVVWIPLMLAIATSARADLSLAFVRSGEDGQAILLRRFADCYAVLPGHVLGDSDFASFVGAGAEMSLGDGDLLRTFGYDLAILRVSGSLAQRCGDSLRTRPDLERVLARNAVAVVHSVMPDGSIVRRRSTVVDLDLVNLRLTSDSGEGFFKGLSGSVVTIDGKPVGFLMKVDPESGQGVALRYDRAIETIRPFFAAKSSSEGTGDGSGVPSRHGGVRSQKSVHDLAAARNGGRIASWSVEPLDGGHRAAMLIDSEEDAATTWLAATGRMPIEIVVDLSGDGVVAVAAVEIVARGVDPPERRPRDFEVLVSNADNGPWRPVQTGTYFPRDDRKMLPFAPTRARFVMLRIHSTWGDRLVGLSALRVLPPSS